MKVLVLGLGISGIKAAEFLKKRGNDVSVFDDNPASIEKISGLYGIYEPDMVYDFAVISPGIPSDHPAVISLINKNIEVIGEMELAGRYIENEKIIAVTGTNGKSTTVSITYEILKEAGYNVLLCGNIGEPVISGVGKGYDFLVIEISSFQLETLKSIHPDISMILNVTPDHLDRYSSYEDYLLTKIFLARLAKPEGLLILNEGDKPLVAACRSVEIQKKFFSAKGTEDISFNNGSLYFGNFEVKVENSDLTCPHNVENIMASVLGTERFVSDPDIMAAAIRKFKPLAHRTEFVADVQGVEFIDDSKGTNVGAVEMALAGYNDSEVVLILGGVDKGGSYEPLRKLADKKCKGIVLIGESAPKIESYFSDFQPLYIASSMSEAVEKAYEFALDRGTVLFSPACSSYDWYNNYKERGLDFQNKVLELKRRVEK